MTGYLPGMRAAAVLQSAVGYRVKVVDMRVSVKRLNQQVAAAPGDIHLGVASGSWTVLRDLGADPEQVIEDGGHDPRIFDGPENFLSHAALGRLYQHCAERTNCPHFGLLVGEKASVSSLGLVGMLMKFSDTLDEALRVLEAHLKIINRGAIVHVERHADTVILSYSVYEPGGGEGVAQLSDGALAAALRVICELCGPKLEPSEVLIPRRQPADLEPYRRVFRAPVRFNEEAVGHRHTSRQDRSRPRLFRTGRLHESFVSRTAG